MTIVDSLGATKVLITDTMSSLRGITANGVTKIATGGRVQSEVSGGARILGEQGNTPARPAIGLFATNGVDDGGGGNGIYRPASNVMAFATSSAERMRITSGGALGIGTAAPAHPLHMGSGAHVTAGGVWTNASSRELKTDIEPLKNEEYSDILKKLEDLEVVHFKYKSEPDVAHIGMIAEDVPDEMASPDRKGIPTADAIAFLMAAVKAQQEKDWTIGKEIEGSRKEVGSNLKIRPRVNLKVHPYNF